MSDKRFNAELAGALSDRIDSDFQRWWVRNLAKAYPWFKARELLWVIGTRFGGAVISSDDGADFQLVDSPQGRVLLAASIYGAAGSLRPWESLGPEPFATALIGLLKDPRHRVMTPAWRAKQERVAFTWLMGTERDPQALWRFCAEPEVTIESDQHWQMRFNAINHRGGVEHWTARGTLDPFSIEPLAPILAAIDGTFFYPEEL